MTKMVVALYDNLSDAQNAVQDLVNQGFRRDDVGLAAHNAQDEHRANLGPDVVSGAASGAGVGAVLGGTAGLLAGLVAFTIPGIGPIVAAGPLATALAGAGVGAVTGGLVAALVDVGVTDEDAQGYAEGVRLGGTLVTVRAADNLADQARQIMNRYGAVDVRTRASQWNAAALGPHSAGGDQPAARPSESDAADEEQIPSYNTSPMQIDEYIGPAEEETTAPDGEAPGAAYGGAEYKGEERTGTLWNRDWGLDDQIDQDFRAHHQLVYGSTSDYGPYQPAYRFGYILASQEQYRGAKWTEIEPRVRREWEGRYPNEPWDNVSEAARYAWERASGSAASGQESRPAGTPGGTGEESRTERPSYQRPQDRQI